MTVVGGSFQPAAALAILADRSAAIAVVSQVAYQGPLFLPERAHIRLVRFTADRSAHRRAAYDTGSKAELALETVDC